MKVAPAVPDKELAAAAEAERCNDLAGAEAAYRAILAVGPHALAAARLAGLLLRRGAVAEAEQFALSALATDATLLPAQMTLAMALYAQGLFERAAAALRAALAAGPDAESARLARLWLGRSLRAAGRGAEAAAVLRNAATVTPDPETVTEWAHALADAGRHAEAEARYRDVLRAAPGYAPAGRGLGNALAWQHRLEAARAAFRDAAAAAPGWDSARFHEGVIALMQGDYAAGWPLYEHRVGEAALAPDRAEPQAPRWQGEAGVRLLLHDEQGFGDTLMFARYIPLAAGRAAVILQLRPDLVPLLRTLPGVQVVERGAVPPPHDAQCPLPSLPLVFGTTAATVPPPEMPFALPPARVAAWRARLAGPRSVGLVWAGGANPPHRAMPAEMLAEVLAVPGVRFWALQKDLSAADRAVLAAHPGVTWVGADLTDFAKTAAALTALDLVIAVDTAVAHLAGALGRTLWVALSFLPDWRWGIDGPSPWYPEARLFRQPGFGAWRAVARALAAALRDWAGGG